MNIDFKEFLQEASDWLSKTYHHFVGNGASDSCLDKLVFSSTLKHPESVLEICCKLSNPLVFSSHDLIVSKFAVPTLAKLLSATKSFL